MKKKLIIGIGLFMILFFILVVWKVGKSDKTISEKTIITSTGNLKETKIEEIKSKNDTLKPTEVSYMINDIPVTKMDIQMEEKKLNVYSEEEKKILCKNGDIILETTKEFVAEQEAKNNGISISASQKERYNEIAEKFYEDSDKTIPKEQFIQIWVSRQEREELASLFMADTLMKMSDNELSCDNDRVKKAVKDYKEKNTLETLNMAYNEYIMYLISTYDIKY